MRGVWFDGVITVRDDLPGPGLRPGWARVAVRQVGICRTDLEISRGYMGFRGIPGHEFVGIVDGCDDPTWLGKRVTAEINASCGECGACRRGLGNHCAARTVLGIHGLAGAMAEACLVPIGNLHLVPDRLSDQEAVFLEPLAAAFQILEQAVVGERTTCLVIGDGKLGILCAWVLGTVSRQVCLAGHHAENLARAAWPGLETTLGVPPADGFDLVVDASGSGAGLMTALACVKPRGTVLLKSTVVSQGEVNLTPAVVKEVTLIGSRCGPFSRAIKGLAAFRFPVERLIDGRFPLDRAVAAWQEAERPGRLKILLHVG